MCNQNADLGQGWKLYSLSEGGPYFFVSILFIYFFKILFIYLTERERESTSRGSVRQGEREKQAPCRAGTLTWGQSQDPGIMT